LYISVTQLKTLNNIITESRHLQRTDIENNKNIQIKQYDTDYPDAEMQS